ncbi:38247_t:CDS:2 [Gigaspora margarita]|uniref:38247_t:CDS:1 n=1 Tax=Gigaspora margarita TaxID=4874 RepID=A0ABN7W0M4_GIGMA|nr:38247_t:CDS:2 [Gigaspora margarita]
MNQKLKLVENIFIRKYSYEEYISLDELLNDFKNKFNNIKSRNDNSIQVFILIGDTNKIFDAICETFGHFFFYINTKKEFDEFKKSDNIQAAVVNEFVRKGWEEFFYNSYDIRNKQIIFLTTKYETDSWIKKVDKDNKRTI